MATIAAIGMAATISVGTALAWAPPSLTALCAPDANHYSWHINLSQEPNYKIQLSWSSDFSNAWLVDFGSSGGHDFDTDRGGSTLYARWIDDQAKKTSAVANDELCEPEETPTPSASASEEPTPTPTVEPTPTPTPEETPTPEVTPTPEQSEEASTPTPTPEQSVAGGTGTPAPSLPDSAMTDASGSNPLPVVAFGLILLASLGALATINVTRTVRNRD